MIISRRELTVARHGSGAGKILDRGKLAVIDNEIDSTTGTIS